MTRKDKRQPLKRADYYEPKKVKALCPTCGQIVDATSQPAGSGFETLECLRPSCGNVWTERY